MTARRWLLVAGLAVLAAALTGPRIAPLYDGVGFPDEPYRYFGAANAPSPVEHVVPKDALATHSTVIQSLESGPQVQVTFDAGSITLPRDATELQLRIAAVVPAQKLPAGTISSNTYQISGNTSSGEPKVANAKAVVALRLPQGVSFHSPPTVIYRRPDGTWKRLLTEQTGNDVYAAQFAGWGEYALAIDLPVPSPSGASASADSAGIAARDRFLMLGAIVVGLVAFVLGAIRFGNRSRHDPPGHK